MRGPIAPEIGDRVVIFDATDVFDQYVGIVVGKSEDWFADFVVLLNGPHGITELAFTDNELEVMA